MGQQETFEGVFGLTTPKQELAILVLDGSGSMSDTERETGRRKAESVEDHILNPDRDRGFIARLKDSARRDSITLAIVTFDHRVEVLLQPTPVADVDLSSLRLDLLARHGGQTAIGDALRRAWELGQGYLAAADEAESHYITILLMSDGDNNFGESPVDVASEIRASDRVVPQSQRESDRPQVVIATAVYGDDAKTDELQRIATVDLKQPGRFHARVQTGKQLRDFLIKSSMLGGK